MAINISKVNLAEVITAEDDPEEIFEILDYLGFILVFFFFLRTK
jgi:hypothetical protein